MLKLLEARTKRYSNERENNLIALSLRKLKYNVKLTEEEELMISMLKRVRGSDNLKELCEREEQKEKETQEQKENEQRVKPSNKEM